MEKYVTVAEAAAALGVDGATLRRRLERGEMRGERVHSRLWLIPQEEVERWKVIGRLRPGPKTKPARGPEPQS